LNEGQVVRRESVVARRDPPTLFDSIEEPLDQVALTVECGLKHHAPNRPPCRMIMVESAGVPFHLIQYLSSAAYTLNPVL
jgi:hypothetical protein